MIHNAPSAVTTQNQNDLTAAPPSLLHRFLATDTRDWGNVLTRIAVGVVILPHGIQKTTGDFGGRGFDATMTGFSGMGIPAPFGFLAIMAECFGALFLILGLATRLSAFGMAVTMTVAAIMGGAYKNGFFMNWFGNQAGEGLQFFIIVVLASLAVMIRGGGAASVDGWLAKKIR